MEKQTTHTHGKERASTCQITNMLGDAKGYAPQQYVTASPLQEPRPQAFYRLKWSI